MAKHFRFRLETVERVRRIAVDRQRRVVAAAQRTVQDAQERIDHCNEGLRASVLDNRERRTAEALDMGSLCREEYYRGWLHRALVDARILLDEARKMLEQERAKLVKERTALRAIEKLRERQWKRHLRETAKEEQALSDEAATQRFLRAAQVGAMP